MQIITAEQKQHLQAGGHIGVTIVADTLHDGQITWTDDDLIEGSLSIDRNSVSRKNIEIGNAETSELVFDLDNANGQWDEYILEGARLAVTFDIDGEPLAGGFYTIDEPPKSLTTMRIRALDDMAKLNRVYETDLNYPATLQQILVDACNKCNVTLYSSSFDNSSYTVDAKPVLDDLTYHHIVSYVAELAGANAYIDWNGELRIAWYGDGQGVNDDIKLGANDRFSYELAENDIQITGILLKRGDDEPDLIVGTDEYAFVIEANPLLQDDHATILSSLYSKLGGFVYRPYSFETLGYPHLWPLDVVNELIDAENNTLLSIITNHNFKLNGNSRIEAKGETETVKGYATGAPFTDRQRRVLQSVAYVETERQVKPVGQSMLQLNQLMANANGFFETIEEQADGSTIKYIHDNAVLEDSQNIWKYDASGFAWTDQGWQGGSPTWQSGVTAGGAMTMRTIATVGVDAEYINADTLAAITADLGHITAGKLTSVEIEGITGTFRDIFTDIDDNWLDLGYDTISESAYLRFYDGPDPHNMRIEHHSSGVTYLDEGYPTGGLALNESFGSLQSGVTLWATDLLRLQAIEGLHVDADDVVMNGSSWKHNHSNGIFDMAATGSASYRLRAQDSHLQIVASSIRLRGNGLVYVDDGSEFRVDGQTMLFGNLNTNSNVVIDPGGSDFRRFQVFRGENGNSVEMAMSGGAGSGVIRLRYDGTDVNRMWIDENLIRFESDIAVNGHANIPRGTGSVLFRESYNSGLERAHIMLSNMDSHGVFNRMYFNVLGDDVMRLANDGTARGLAIFGDMSATGDVQVDGAIRMTQPTGPNADIVTTTSSGRSFLMLRSTSNSSGGGAIYLYGENDSSSLNSGIRFYTGGGTSMTLDSNSLLRVYGDVRIDGNIRFGGTNYLPGSQLRTDNTSLSGSISAGSNQNFQLVSPYTFFPNFFGSASIKLGLHSNQTGSGQNARFNLANTGGTTQNYNIQYRYIAN